VQLLALLVVEALRQDLRRPVVANEQLPYRFSGLHLERRVEKLELEVEVTAQEIADVVLAAPVERIADARRRSRLILPHDSEDLGEPGIGGPAGQADVPARFRDAGELLGDGRVIWREHHATGRGDDVEACVLEVERLRVADAIVDVEPALVCQLLRLLDQRGREVDSNDLDPFRCNEFRNGAGSAGKVENPLSRLWIEPL
jgi:hypothetical protein